MTSSHDLDSPITRFPLEVSTVDTFHPAADYDDIDKAKAVVA